jgi:hypothetical protein
MRNRAHCTCCSPTSREHGKSAEADAMTGSAHRSRLPRMCWYSLPGMRQQHLVYMRQQVWISNLRHRRPPSRLAT